MISGRAWARRALAVLPDLQPGPSSLFFALGVATAVSLALATVEQLVVRLTPLRPPLLAAEPLIAGIAVALLYAMHGTRATRLALAATAVTFASVAGTYGDLALSYAIFGRAPLVRDPIGQAGAGLFAIAVFAVAGAVAGLVAQRWLPEGRPTRPPVLVAAIGVAFFAGAIVRLLWPNQFIAAALVPAARFDPRTSLVLLPHALAGPLAGGAYAARHGVGYRDLTIVGGLLSAPTVLLQFGFTLAAADQRVAVLIPDLRAQAALGWFLIALRIAAWPLAMAFVHAFLTPPDDGRRLA